MHQWLIEIPFLGKVLRVAQSSKEFTAYIAISTGSVLNRSGIHWTAGEAGVVIQSRHLRYRQSLQPHSMVSDSNYDHRGHWFNRNGHWRVSVFEGWSRTRWQSAPRAKMTHVKD